MSYSRKKKRTGLLIFLVVLLLVLILVITYANLKNTPTWNEVGETAGVVNQNSYSECIRFLDVGQGDAAVITSGGRNSIIDVGTPEGADKLCSKLKNLGVDGIDVLMLSHNHDDHIGGAEAVVNNFKIANMMLPDISNTKSPTRIIKNITQEVNSYGAKVVTARSGAYYKVGNIKITVLCQHTECSNENDRSIVAMAEYEGNKFLFTGDAGSPVENKILKEGINVDCDVLKVGHHGSSGSSNAKFLSRATPDYAVISCGEGNVYNHPHDEAIARLEKIGAKILRTDISGDITFYSNGKKLTVETEK